MSEKLEYTMESIGDDVFITLKDFPEHAFAYGEVRFDDVNEETDQGYISYEIVLRNDLLTPPQEFHTAVGELLKQILMETIESAAADMLTESMSAAAADSGSQENSDGN